MESCPLVQLDVGIKINDLNMSNSFFGGLEHGFYMLL